MSVNKNTEISGVLLAGIVATSAFTIFSYLVSKKRHKNFRQPELMGQMIHQSALPLNKNSSLFTGWLMHYLIGIGFAISFDKLIEITHIKPNLTNGIMLGAISSVPAALSWQTAFTAHPAPPRNKKAEYFLELLAGHILFGVSCLLSLSLVRKKKLRLHVKSYIRH